MIRSPGWNIFYGYFQIYHLFSFDITIVKIANKISYFSQHINKDHGDVSSLDLFGAVVMKDHFFGIFLSEYESWRIFKTSTLIHIQIFLLSTVLFLHYKPFFKTWDSMKFRQPAHFVLKGSFRSEIQDTQNFNIFHRKNCSLSLWHNNTAYHLFSRYVYLYS